MRAIAAGLGRSPATISRELRRNRDPDSGQYRPFTAQRLAVGQRARPGRGKLLHDPVLAQFVQDRLGKRWSPEQISHALHREFPDEPQRHVVHETIYQAIYRPELGGLRRDLVGSEYRILGLTSRLWVLVFDHAAMWYSLVSPSRIGLR